MIEYRKIEVDWDKLKKIYSDPSMSGRYINIIDEAIFTYLRYEQYIRENYSNVTKNKAYELINDFYESSWYKVLKGNNLIKNNK